MNYDRGLIRYTSERALEEGKDGKSQPAAPKAYRLLYRPVCDHRPVCIHSHQATVLEFEALRDRQSLFTTNSQGLIENIYTLKLVNKSQKPHTLTISVSGLEGATLRGETRITLERVTLPASSATGRASQWTHRNQYHHCIPC